MWPTHYIPNQPRVDGQPPPRFYLTTPPYPVQVVEELYSTLGVPRLGFAPSAEAEEYMTSHGTPVGGTLAGFGFLTYEMEDYLESYGVPIGGALTGDLVRISVAPDEVTAYGIPLSGTLQYAKVEYENWPLGVDLEDLTAHGVPLSGALT